MHGRLYGTVRVGGTIRRACLFACLRACLLVMRVRICTRIYIYSIYPTVFLTYYKYRIITMQLNGYPAPTRPLPNAPDPLNEVCVVRSTLYLQYEGNICVVLKT